MSIIFECWKILFTKIMIYFPSMYFKKWNGGFEKFFANFILKFFFLEISWFFREFFNFFLNSSRFYVKVLLRSFFSKDKISSIFLENPQVFSTVNFIKTHYLLNFNFLHKFLKRLAVFFQIVFFLFISISYFCFSFSIHNPRISFKFFLRNIFFSNFRKKYFFLTLIYFFFKISAKIDILFL